MSKKAESITKEKAVETSDTVETEAGKGHMMDVAAGTLSVELPCGYLDLDGALHETIIVREMTGHEEDILGGKGPILGRLNKIISNCTVKIGEIEDRKQISVAVNELTATDRMATLIALRRVSLGDFYDIRVTCPDPNCRWESRFNLNLADIEIVKMKDPMSRHHINKIDGGMIIKWHVMTTRDEQWLTQKMKKKEDILTLGMLARVDMVGDVEIDRDSKFPHALATLKNLGMKKRLAIRSLFDKIEGSVDTDVEFVCPTCEFEWKSQMDLGQASFFFPSEM